MKTLLLLGATGLVGRATLRLALADPRVARIVAPTRRALGEAHPRLENPLVDFDTLPDEAAWWRVDGVLCALGTTIRKAGSQSAFRRVDHDYPLAVGRLARGHGASAYAFVSSLGASPRTRNFYLRTKGETEEALAVLGFPSLTCLRPSLIGGERAESRPAERIGITLVRVLGPLVPRRYRVVPAERIARALIEAATTAPAGRRIVESEAI